jgi:hypothetical protein
MRRFVEILPLFPGEEKGTQAVAALALLRRAWDQAHARQVKLWQCAVSVGQFWAAGVRTDVLRELLEGRYVEHRREGMGRRRGPRVFEPGRPSRIGGRSCFVLTRKGVDVVRWLILGARSGPGVLLGGTEAGCAGPVPTWVEEDRALLWQGKAVKQFGKQPAGNQVLVLQAWQETNFANPLLDPLPRSKGVRPKSRFHDVLKGLNRNQVNPLLRFRGDGTGQRALWEPR